MFMNILMRIRVFSDYPKISQFYDSVNKKVIGKMKDEFKGKIINEFFGLQPKVYSLVTVDSREIKNTNGINRNVANEMRHKKYVDMLYSRRLVRHRMKMIQRNL